MPTEMEYRKLHTALEGLKFEYKEVKEAHDAFIFEYMATNPSREDLEREDGWIDNVKQTVSEAHATVEYTLEEWAHAMPKTWADAKRKREDYKEMRDQLRELTLRQSEITQQVIQQTLEKVGENANKQNAFLAEAMSSANTQLAEKIQQPPKIETFSGENDDYFTFKALFQNSYDKLTTFAEDAKYAELRRLLKGEAAKVIAHLPCEAESYRMAWSLLDKQYDRPEAVVARQTAKWEARQRVTPSSANREFREAYLQMEQMSRVWRIYKQPDGGVMMINMWLRKWPSKIREVWETKKLEKRISDHDTLRFLEFMGLQVRAKENAAQYQDLSQEAKSKPKGESNQPKEGKKQYGSGWKPRQERPDQRGPERATAWALKAEEGARPRGLPCRKCRDTRHNLSECQEFKKIKNRSRKIEWVKKARACFRCGDTDHLAKNCPSGSVMCEVEGCQSRHTKAMHC